MKWLCAVICAVITIVTGCSYDEIEAVEHLEESTQSMLVAINHFSADAPAGTIFERSAVLAQARGWPVNYSEPWEYTYDKSPPDIHLHVRDVHHAFLKLGPSAIKSGFFPSDQIAGRLIPFHGFRHDTTFTDQYITDGETALNGMMLNWLMGMSHSGQLGAVLMEDITLALGGHPVDLSEARDNFKPHLSPLQNVSLSGRRELYAFHVNKMFNISADFSKTQGSPRSAGIFYLEYLPAYRSIWLAMFGMSETDLKQAIFTLDEIALDNVEIYYPLVFISNVSLSADPRTFNVFSTEWEPMGTTIKNLPMPYYLSNYYISSNEKNATFEIRAPADTVTIAKIKLELRPAQQAGETKNCLMDSPVEVKPGSDHILSFTCDPGLPGKYIFTSFFVYELYGERYGQLSEGVLTVSY